MPLLSHGPHRLTGIDADRTLYGAQSVASAAVDALIIEGGCKRFRCCRCLSSYTPQPRHLAQPDDTLAWGQGEGA